MRIRAHTSPLKQIIRKIWTPSGIDYQQGQQVAKTREYFYYIDHQGQLFLDDARMKNFTSCYKEVAFLNFFYRRLKANQTGRYEKEFPYVSTCGPEKNYLRCDDRPHVFTFLDFQTEMWKIGGSNISFPLEITRLCMFPNGRLYHPSSFGNYALVKSKLADLLYPHFIFNSNGDPTHIRWKGKEYDLSQDLLKYSS
ncbi:hypothetical protein AB6A40_005614 [Gnathostoma spinigerum]|uniref:Uncharacterized protein n=1 Tax=Gnathostoma spinigerum TaxID=75299 RepID=A0ABD6EFX9_9BILA